MQLCLGMGVTIEAENFWVRISGQTNMGGIVMAVCYKTVGLERIRASSSLKIYYVHHLWCSCGASTILLQFRLDNWTVK